MKVVRIRAIVLIAFAAFTVSAFAQGAAKPAPKVMFINTEEFLAATGGITRYVTAVKGLDTSFNPAREQIRTMMTRHDALAREVSKLQEQINAAPNAVGTPALVKQLEAKVEEGRALETDIKRRQEDNKANFERQFNASITPIQDDIRRALQEFAKQRGYTVVLDISKLGPSIVSFDDSADITKDFIAYYNVRPAPAAARPAGTP